jgi:hypothetical protein
MRNDYLITIFSRNRGKTRTFGLDRRVAYILLALLIFTAISCILLGQAYFHERGERQRLQARTALLEQLMSKLEQRSGMQGEETPTEATAEIEVQRSLIDLAQGPQHNKVAAEPSGSGSQVGEEVEDHTHSAQPSAKIGDARVTSLGEGREGFRLDFKLINLAGEPISGNIAIIASLKPPHTPRLVPFPSMKLVDGMPVKLRKTVGFDIRYYKYMSGRFYFPFSYSESFRILVYNRDEALILDSTLPAEEVGAHGSSAEESTPSDDSSS